MKNFRYSSWDGTQDEFSLDVDSALDALSDLMMEGLDAQQALEWMRQYGFEMARLNMRVMGIEELLRELQHLLPVPALGSVRHEPAGSPLVEAREGLARLERPLLGQVRLKEVAAVLGERGLEPCPRLLRPAGAECGLRRVDLPPELDGIDAPVQLGIEAVQPLPDGDAAAPVARREDRRQP